jgi:mycothiol synthase
MAGDRPRDPVQWKPGWPDLVMRRDRLDGLEPIELPAGYALRHFAAGDEAAWTAIMDDAFGPWEPHDFDAMIGRDDRFAAARVWFVVSDDGDRPIGSATAWRHARFGTETGYLHMVGVRAAYRGHRFGRALSLAVLHRFAAEALEAAVLETQDFRLPAIRTYLRLGFQPAPADEHQRERWQRVLHALETP